MPNKREILKKIWVIASPWLSVAAVIMSIIALCHKCPRLTCEFDYVGVIVAILAALIALLVGWNILSVIDVKGLKGEMDKLRENLNKQLENNMAEFERQMADNKVEMGKQLEENKVKLEAQLEKSKNELKKQLDETKTEAERQLSELNKVTVKVKQNLKDSELFNSLQERPGLKDVGKDRDGGDSSK